MNIVSEKMHLRALEEKDCDMLLRIINDPDTERMLGGSSFPVSSVAQKDWLINKASGKNILRCAIVPADNNDVAVGTAMLTDIDEKNATAEIHIKLDLEVRHEGYGTQAINLLVKYAFEQLRLNCLYAKILEANIPSQKLFEKCGFSKEGVLRSRLYKDGEYKDLLIYSILKND